MGPPERTAPRKPAPGGPLMYRRFRARLESGGRTDDAATQTTAAPRGCAGRRRPAGSLSRRAEVAQRVLDQRRAVRGAGHALEAEAPVEGVLGRDARPVDVADGGRRRPVVRVGRAALRGAGCRPVAEAVLEGRLVQRRAVGGDLRVVHEDAEALRPLVADVSDRELALLARVGAEVELERHEAPRVAVGRVDPARGPAVVARRVTR